MHKKEKNFVPSEKGKKIKELRSNKGWSQQRLALEAKVSRGTIQNIESGKHGSLDKTLSHVLTALGGIENAIEKEGQIKNAEENEMEENLIRMARSVLRSGTTQASALHANIIAFYDSLRLKEGLDPTLRGPERSG